MCSFFNYVEVTNIYLLVRCTCASCSSADQFSLVLGVWHWFPNKSLSVCKVRLLNVNLTFQGCFLPFSWLFFFVVNYWIRGHWDRPPDCSSSVWRISKVFEIKLLVFMCISARKSRLCVYVVGLKEYLLTCVQVMMRLIWSVWRRDIRDTDHLKLSYLWETFPCCFMILVLCKQGKAKVVW